MPLFHQAALSALTNLPVTEERYAAVYDAALTAVRAEYPDPENATGRALDVVRSVALSVGLRLITNPAGARNVGLGSANVTFGGGDATVSSPAELTPSERLRLQRLKSGRRGVRQVDILLPTEDVETAYADTSSSVYYYPQIGGWVY